MANVKMIWNPEFHGPHGMIGEWLEKKTEELEFLAKSSVGVQSGKLQISIDRTPVRTAGPGILEATVGANPRQTEIGYGMYHHEGTQPHVIEPKDKQGWLYFRVRGKLVRARRVNHPGTRPNNYLTRWLRVLFK